MIFWKYFPKNFVSSEKSSTFALAFGKTVPDTALKKQEKRVLWQDLHKQKVVVQEASEETHLGKKRTDQFASLIGGKEKKLLNRLKDSRPEQDNDALP